MPPTCTAKRRDVALSEVSTDGDLRPRHDDTFVQLLEHALQGTIPVFYGVVPLALCIPFDADYRPDLHEAGAAAIQFVMQEKESGTDRQVVVYQRGRWFVVSDDYIPLFAALDASLDFLPCWIMGVPTGNDVEQLQGPLDPDTVRRVLLPQPVSEGIVLTKTDD